jgi:putative peptidoglycan lipid II flippase
MTDAARRQIRAATLIWMASVAASRLAGLLREMVIARSAGATGLTDAYFTAFTLPDIINYLLAGGALSITFIPIFTSFLIKGDDEEGWRVFWSVMTILGTIMLTLLVLAWVFAEPICRQFASGFTEEQQRHLVHYTRILLPAQFFFFAGGLFGAVQMARHRHGFYAFSPLVYNGGIIVGGLLLRGHGMEGFCWGALIGAFLGHGVLQAWGAWSSGMRFSTRLALRHPAVRTYFALALPVMIGQSIVVTDDWLVRHYGSGLAQASISWLNYAKKLALVLPAILGQAAAAGTFPTLSRQAESGNLREMSSVLSEGLRRALLLSAFGAALLAVLNREAAFLAFGSGRFTPADTLTTGHALAILCASVPAMVAHAILARGYYALRANWQPTVLGTVITLLGIPFYGYMARSFGEGGGYLGLATATTLSFIVYAVALYVGLSVRLRRHDPEGGRLLPASFLLRGLAAVTVTLVGSALVRGGVGALWPDLNFVQSLLRAGIVGVTGLLIFLGMASALHLERETVILGILSRRFPRR